jgi:hypothetical protein
MESGIPISASAGYAQAGHKASIPRVTTIIRRSPFDLENILVSRLKAEYLHGESQGVREKLCR